MQRIAEPPRPAPLSSQQVAWRLLRNLDAEFVAVAAGAYWVAMSVEDGHATAENVASIGEHLGMAGNRIHLVDANSVAEAEIRRILDTCAFVVGSVARTSEGRPLRRMIDIHYDVPVELRSLKDKVNRYVFGYRLASIAGVRIRAYRYGGIVHRKGVRWIGQSVLRLPSLVADEVESRLRSWGVSVTREEIFEAY